MCSLMDIEIVQDSVEVDENKPTPRIKVMGIGGGGSNAVNHMAREQIKNVDFIICNTDIQALRESPVKNRIQIGKDLTEGLGAGCQPQVGRNAVIETADEIRSLLEKDTKVLFITAGMGGGTGTGAAPQIAKIARELGILTVGIVSVPFEFEGEKKIKQAMAGIDELEEYVDTMSIIINDRLLDENNSMPLSDAFKMADNVLTMAAKSIADVIMMPGYINIDLRDVCTVMRDKGVALIGSGVGDGEGRAVKAVEAALYSPLLRDRDIKGASYVLIHIQYGSKEHEVTIQEHTEITDYVLGKVGQLTNVIWGTGEDESLGSNLRVSIVATGFSRSADNAVRFASTTPKERVIRVESKASPTETGFDVVPKRVDLAMKIEDSAEIERKARLAREQKERKERAAREEAEKEAKRVAEMEAKQSRQMEIDIDAEEESDFYDFDEMKSDKREESAQSRALSAAEALDKWFTGKLGVNGSDFQLND